MMISTLPMALIPIDSNGILVLVICTQWSYILLGLIVRLMKPGNTIHLVVVVEVS